MATIFHLALASEWAAAEASGAYTTSTLGRSLAEEGFIHASRADQWTAVRDRFYADVAEPLVLLEIDTDLLDVPVVEEPPAPGVEETFPHIYGRLPASAVVKAIPLSPGTTTAAPRPAAPAVATAPAATAAPAASARPGESFSRTYFREMFFNVLVVSLALVICTAGLGIGMAIGGDRAPGISGLVGLALGVVVAVLVYRRRHPRKA
ncbi:uncharacterized protein (DUF952 family) [Nocardioides aromaticivorans]|uniref:Uncharacterized protein (DUF952 family) n=1 Tax=Nocardioides aromaticivorans TaxID=200618 RepID=A0A7Y9ZJS9_9ACTN|nr:DUF952 domain-containing protein [Nocardioides aromaticivorans]NYI46794.1 uncharacterized protein (DUF952 family) [Nocardioides aromaticivorans]